MEENVIEKAKVLVGDYQAGKFEGFEVPFAISGNIDTFDSIGCADTGTEKGTDGVSVYDPATQETIFGLFDTWDVIVIVAPYESEFHVFVVEGLEVTFLGAFSE